MDPAAGCIVNTSFCSPDSNTCAWKQNCTWPWEINTSTVRNSERGLRDYKDFNDENRLLDTWLTCTCTGIYQRGNSDNYTDTNFLDYVEWQNIDTFFWTLLLSLYASSPVSDDEYRLVVNTAEDRTLVGLARVPNVDPRFFPAPACQAISQVQSGFLCTCVN